MSFPRLRPAFPISRSPRRGKRESRTRIKELSSPNASVGDPIMSYNACKDFGNEFFRPRVVFFRQSFLIFQKYNALRAVFLNRCRRLSGQQWSSKIVSKVFFDTCRSKNKFIPYNARMQSYRIFNLNTKIHGCGVIAKTTNNPRVLP